MLVGFGEGASKDAGPGYDDLRYYAVRLGKRLSACVCVVLYICTGVLMEWVAMIC